MTDYIVPGSSKGDVPIVTVSEASRRIGVDRRWLRGWMAARGVKLTWVGKALVLTDADFRNVAEALAREAEPEPVSA